MAAANDHHLQLLLWLGRNQGSVQIEDGDDGKRILCVRALVGEEWKVIARPFSNDVTLDGAVKLIHQQIVAFGKRGTTKP